MKNEERIDPNPLALHSLPELSQRLTPRAEVHASEETSVDPEEAVEGFTYSDGFLGA